MDFFTSLPSPKLSFNLLFSSNSDFHKDPLAPKIIKLSDCESEEGKEKEEENSGVLVGTIDITKPVFGVSYLFDLFYFLFLLT